MTTTMAAEVLTDPLGVVVDLVADVEPTLERPVIADVVASVAGGRTKRRRLAQALLERPTLLRDGRSPAPRVVADLLIALRKAGASTVSPPVCTECGKRLGSLQRRGEDWYCGACGPVPEPCTGCGHTRPVSCRDRDGRPRCVGCRPEDERDPVDLIVDVVTGLDPTLSADQVVAAVQASVPQPGQRRRLAWALQDRPDLLTGAGAEAPAPCVLRLVDKLCDAGARKITRPACPHCHRVTPLHRRIDRRWLCRSCVAKSRAQPCARCAVVREPAARDEHGRPLCSYCLTIDPANQETCISCCQRRPVSVRTADGPLCPACRPTTTMTCSICGRYAPCAISKTTGQPWCQACQQRRARCTGCGQVRPVRGGTLDEPRCATCTRPQPGFWRDCPGCGQPGRIHNGPCARCALGQRLRELFGDDNGEIRPELRALHHALTTTDRTDTVVAWLDRSTVPTILRDLVGKRLTHDTLDELPAAKTVEHLRSVLVAIGTLPARDEQMTRLQRWVTHTIAERTDPDQQHLLRRYAVWHLLRRLRHRTNGRETTHTQLDVLRQRVRGAITLLDWLTAHDLTLATCRQSDLDTWLTSPQATHRSEAGHFIRWAKKQKLTRLDFPAAKWGGPQRVLDTEARWQQARRLLHDDTIKPDDRVAGLLVLLYAQWPSAVSRLTLDHIHASGDEVGLQLGREPVVLPEPLASLVLKLVDNRRGHAAIGDQGTSPWLFPGGQPGRPISAYRLGERLRQLGLHPGQARSTALFQLATDLPAAMLARLLGIHISVAVAWQRASSGDWANYAAEVSRRKPHEDRAFRQF